MLRTEIPLIIHLLLSIVHIERTCKVIKVTFVIEFKVKHVRVEIRDVLDEILKVGILEVELKVIEADIVAVVLILRFLLGFYLDLIIRLLLLMLSDHL